MLVPVTGLDEGDPGFQHLTEEESTADVEASAGFIIF
jgi:hypothetical protein